MQTLEQILQTACQTTPTWQEVSAFHPTIDEYSHIQAITYDSLGNTSTFAYLGIPEGASAENPVPGIVLVHGGGGRVYLPWVKMWNDRGYAAIAMSTRGLFPNGVNAGTMDNNDPGYQHGMYGSFVKEGYVDSPNEDAMKNADLPLEARWITNALVKVIHAHNLLRSFDCIDSSRIGITGISWGGNITSLAITHDPRFAFAIPVYGSGFLKDAVSYMGEIFQNPGNAQFRAEDRFDGVKMPVLWVAWNDDNNFSVNSNSLSYLATAKNNPKNGLALVHNMWHSHTSGWAPPVIGAFADWVVKGGAPLVTFATQPAGKNACAKLNVPGGASDLQGQLYWIDAPMTYSAHDKFRDGTNLTYMDQVWQIAPATVEGDTLSAVVPNAAYGYYLELRYTVNAEQMIATSVFTIKE